MTLEGAMIENTIAVTGATLDVVGAVTVVSTTLADKATVLTGPEN